MNESQKQQKADALRTAEGNTKSHEQQKADALKKSMEDCYER